MNTGTFLALFQKLENLVGHLPEGLQGPILREILPIKTLFLLQRGPRLVLLGDRSASTSQLINALFRDEVVARANETLRDGFWQKLQGAGAMEVLDARRPVSTHVAQLALQQQPADLFIFLRQGTDLDGELAADLGHAKEIMGGSGERRSLIGLQFGGDESARESLHGALHTEPPLESRMIGTLTFKLSDMDSLVELLGVELPPEAQLEMARLSGNRVLQRQIAQVLIKSATAMSAAVGAQPIPLADFPILTAMQSAIVVGVMHISGREANAKLAGEFIAAMGASIGMGLALREGARAAVKILPVWGNAISGAVAATGTYSIGQAAIAYFIDGASIKDAKSFFKSKKPSGLLK